ncbi:cilium assembly [Mactra antiquata]
MADSCRPVSRHGRYNSTGPSSVQYTGDVSSYGNVDYTPTDEMYTVNQPERPPERPKTGRGRRRRAEIPPRPESRRGGQDRRMNDDDESETYGRPMSRVGFSPDQSYRYSHDEYSRQQSSDNEKQILNSPCSSPEILYQDENYFATQKALFPPNNQQSDPVDRLIVSPSNPQEVGGGKSHRRNRKSPQMYGQSPQGSSYRDSPQGYRESPQYGSHYGQPSPKFHGRPSSREYMNVSPLHRDEQQIQDVDLHRHDAGPYMSEDPYPQDGDSYRQRFSDSPHYQNNPYQDSPLNQDSPSHVRDSPYHNHSPGYGTHRGYTGSPDSRPPPAPRPKSSRPRTGRKKSARVRQQQQHRYQEQETSPPQQCDTTSILNSGDPYGRPSSSLSPYKPLPAIGVSTPRTPPEKSERDHKNLHDSVSERQERKIDNVTVETKRMMLEETAQYHPVDDNTDMFRVEDIQGASGEHYGNYTGQGIPEVQDLTHLPQTMSEEILKSSVSNYEKHITGDGFNENDIENNDAPYVSDNNRSPAYKPLDILHELPVEPSEGEPRVLLAIKLPDGKRIQRYFSPQDNLETVMHYAENDNLVNYEDYLLVCNAPRTTFTDLSMKIEETQLRDRTVLYLEEKD